MFVTWFGRDSDDSAVGAASADTGIVAKGPLLDGWADEWEYDLGYVGREDNGDEDISILTGGGVTSIPLAPEGEDTIVPRDGSNVLVGTVVDVDDDALDGSDIPTSTVGQPLDGWADEWEYDLGYVGREDNGDDSTDGGASTYESHARLELGDLLHIDPSDLDGDGELASVVHPAGLDYAQGVNLMGSIDWSVILNGLGWAGGGADVSADGVGAGFAPPSVLGTVTPAGMTVPLPISEDLQSVITEAWA